jgi:hypothetical protein
MSRGRWLGTMMPQVVHVLPMARLLRTSICTCHGFSECCCCSGSVVAHNDRLCLLKMMRARARSGRRCRDRRRWDRWRRLGRSVTPTRVSGDRRRSAALLTRNLTRCQVVDVAKLWTVPRRCTGQGEGSGKRRFEAHDVSEDACEK